MPTDTYFDDRFEEDDFAVTVPDGVELSVDQRWTIIQVANNLNNEVCFALIEDQTCVVLPADDARYGFDYFSHCVSERIDEYEYYPPDFRMTYAGGGEYLLIVFGSLIRLVLEEDYPEMPTEFRGMGIPVASQVSQRDRAIDACDEYYSPLAMVVPRDPVYHEEYDEKKAAWVEEDDSPEDYDPTGVKRLERILRGEDVVVTWCDVEAIETDWYELKNEMLADFEEMERERDDEIASLTDSGGTDGRSSSESISAQIKEIEERCEHRESIREMALNALRHIEEGSAFENSEVADDIRRFYIIYVTLETGPKVVRQLLVDQGIDPEAGIDEFASVVSELREAVAASGDNAVLENQLAQAELVYGLLRELQEME